MTTAAPMLQSLRGRATAAEERLAAAQSAAEFAAKQAPGRAVVDHRVAQLEQQLMHAQESCRSQAQLALHRMYPELLPRYYRTKCSGQL
jgi:TfoX/Sxy family transcriptional regulator of competence genes